MIEKPVAVMARPSSPGFFHLPKKYKHIVLGGLLCVSAVLLVVYLASHKVALWLPDSIQGRQFLDGYLDWDSVRVQTFLTHAKVRQTNLGTADAAVKSYPCACPAAGLPRAG